MVSGLVLAVKCPPSIANIVARNVEIMLIVKLTCTLLGRVLIISTILGIVVMLAVRLC